MEAAACSSGCRIVPETREMGLHVPFPAGQFAATETCLVCDTDAPFLTVNDWEHRECQLTSDTWAAANIFRNQVNKAKAKAKRKKEVVLRPFSPLNAASSEARFPAGASAAQLCRQSCSSSTLGLLCPSQLHRVLAISQETETETKRILRSDFRDAFCRICGSFLNN